MPLILREWKTYVDFYLFKKLLSVIVSSREFLNLVDRVFEIGGKYISKSWKWCCELSHILSKIGQFV